MAQNFILKTLRINFSKITKVWINADFHEKKSALFHTLVIYEKSLGIQRSEQCHVVKGLTSCQDVDVFNKITLILSIRANI